MGPADPVYARNYTRVCVYVGNFTRVSVYATRGALFLAQRYSQMSSYSLDMNSLPIEMRSKNFHEYVCNVRPGKESIRAPVRISSVCRQWRKESLSFGVLWTYLKYYVDGVPPDWLIEVFDTWLQRSNGAPLNFSFTCHLYSHRSKEDYLVAERIVLMLLDHQNEEYKISGH
ncbi:uncharacterized protein FOMMEDRAFT_153814 [Fomitiporia mediterranea MF3/22]|uniref:uncharacterized protein n=1 Tax=Fomitiporia mediterranea (strain MF3/22) TaxID=694068 RepID=UPI0004407A3D|nr:uncharacterized protein FOMMEDRAFT_153814 [Fomitiporia mediterranea MF3/22]EJD04738.1 hypothetical protein FOMMEDRAFT_153814 [Fomitiporia mediterranea MF3/22]